MSNATWKWRRTVAGANRQHQQQMRDRGAATQDARSQAAASNRAKTERERLTNAAQDRERERLAGIAARREIARRTVLGLEAGKRAAQDIDATPEWTTRRWNELQDWMQERCWQVLRPAIGLKPASFKELVTRLVRRRSNIREGTETPRPRRAHEEQRKQRKGQLRNWRMIGTMLIDNAESGYGIAADELRRRAKRWEKEAPNTRNHSVAREEK